MRENQRSYPTGQICAAAAVVDMHMHIHLESVPLVMIYLHNSSLVSFQHIQPNMICTTCYCMLRGQTGRQWRGTYDIHFSHHPTLYSLERSATMSCCICRIIWDELTENYQGTRLVKVLQKNLRTSSDLDRFVDSNRTQASSERQVQFLRAFLSEVQGGQDNDLYRLDFRLVDSDSKRLATFLLEKSSKSRPRILLAYTLSHENQRTSLTQRSIPRSPTIQAPKRSCNWRDFGCIDVLAPIIPNAPMKPSTTEFAPIRLD